MLVARVRSPWEALTRIPVLGCRSRPRILREALPRTLVVDYRHSRITFCASWRCLSWGLNRGRQQGSDLGWLSVSNSDHCRRCTEKELQLGTRKRRRRRRGGVIRSEEHTSER